MSAIVEFWCENHTVRVRRPGWAACRHVRCADGFVMSVQASADHYCEPREYIHSGAYSEWEVGLPSVVEPLILEYAYDPARPTKTFYPYVPTDIVDAVIAKHGGLAEEAS